MYGIYRNIAGDNGQIILQRESWDTTVCILDTAREKLCTNLKFGLIFFYSFLHASFTYMVYFRSCFKLNTFHISAVSITYYIQNQSFSFLLPNRFVYSRRKIRYGTNYLHLIVFNVIVMWIEGVFDIFIRERLYQQYQQTSGH